MYDDVGRVHGQITLRSAAPVRRTWETASREQLLRLLRSQSAFYGAYEVDTARHRVVHRLEHELPPGPGNFEQILPYRIVGDTLHLGAADRRRWLLVRLRPSGSDPANRRSSSP